MKEKELDRVKNTEGKLVFVKGKSGNPLGRPKGSKTKGKELAEALLGNNASKVVQTIISKALDPNDKDQAAMLKLCLDRIVPPQRAIDVSGEIKQSQAIQIVVDGVTAFANATHKVIEQEIEDVEFEETNEEK